MKETVFNDINKCYIIAYSTKLLYIMYIFTPLAYCEKKTHWKIIEQRTCLHWKNT